MELTCSSCGNRFVIARQRESKQVLCPRCGTTCAEPVETKTAAWPATRQNPDASETESFPEDGVSPSEAASEQRSTVDVTHPNDPPETHPPEELPPTIDFVGGPPEPAMEHARGAGRAIPKGVPSIPNYELLGLLGRGGMGLVLEARDRKLDRLIAIKLPLSRRAGRLKRFLREARSAARLRHPNICSIHEVGEVESRPYIVMDLIRGRTLGDWAAGESPSPRRSAEIVAKLARAVAYAHERGVIHRDLKPSNVMLDAETGEPVLMDFGLAKEVTLEGSGLTRSGEMVGTPAYMSPEQAAGRQHEIGPSSDVYALGAVLYELLCARRPFDGQLGEVVLKIQNEDPVPPRRLVPRVHRDLETICLKAMAKAPAERYESAEQLADDLERFCAGEAILARRHSVAARAWRAAVRRPVLSLTVAAALLVMAVGAYLVVRGQHDRRVAGLLASLEADFDRGDWSREGLADMDATLEQLAARAPERAAAGRARLVRRFSEAIEKELSSPTLSPDRVTRVEALLDLLAERDAREAAHLRAALQRRLHAWKEVVALSSPFSRLQEVFDPAHVTIRGESLVRAEDLVPDRAPVVRTLVGSDGAVRLEATFDSSWEDVSQLGLLLGAAESGGKNAGENPSPGDRGASSDAAGYRFLLRTALRSAHQHADETRPLSFAEVRQRGGRLVIEILRGRTALRRVHVESEDLPPGSLRLTATKLGDQLRLTVGSLPSVDFRDPFPFRGMKSGVFAVWWPAEARISQVRLLRRTLPETPSPLQRGDALYAAERFAEAAAAYQQQAQAFGSAEAGQEARYKEAICLLALNQSAEAEELLKSLAGEPGDRWPALATCQLWLQRVRSGQFGETDAIFESVAARYRLEQLAELVPCALHDEIVRGYSAQSTKLNLYQPNPAMVQECERALAIAELFSSDPTVLSWARQQLVRAYRAAGREERALELAAWVVNNAEHGRLEHGEHDLVLEYAWLLRLAGRPEEALAEVDRWIQSPKDRHPAHRQHERILERARILVALERWEEAEETLDGLLTSLDGPDRGGRYVAACAMLGFLRERRGDDLAAQQAWENGARAEWSRADKGFALLDGVIVASAAGDVSEEETKAFVKKMSAWAAGGSPLLLAESPLGDYFLSPRTIASVFRGAFRGPRGREYARKIVFRQMSFAECVRTPMLLIAAEAIRQTGMAGQVTDEQDAIIWAVVEDGYSAVFEKGTLSKAQLLQLGFTWKGITNFVGWAGVESGLDPQLRGPVAYVTGHRYLRLARPEGARMFFRTAKADAPDGSTLKALAQTELDRLAGDVADEN